MIRVSGIILMAAFVVFSSGLPSGEPNAESIPSSPSISDLIAQAQEGITNLGTDLQQRFNIPDQETVVNSIKTQSTDLVNNVRSYIERVSEDIKAKSPELESTWNDIKAKLSKVADDINEHIPNAQEQGRQLQDKFTNALQILVNEANITAEAFGKNSENIQEEVTKMAKQAVDIALRTTQNLDKQLRELAVTETPK